jgi:hypothetical protein
MTPPMALALATAQSKVPVTHERQRRAGRRARGGAAVLSLIRFAWVAPLPCIHPYWMATPRTREASGI